MPSALTRGAGARAAYTPHGGSLHYSWGSVAGAVHLGLEQLRKGRTDGLIRASESARRTDESAIGAPPCPHRVVHDGLDDEEFTPVPRGSEEYGCVFVGEIRRLEGIDVLLEDVAELRRQREPFLPMVGAGPG